MQRASGLFRKRVAVIDAESCRKCALCVRACPLGALKGGPGRVPVVDEKLCIGCGICVEACPFNVITLRTRWSILPLATLAIAAVVAFAAAAWVYQAWHGGEAVQAVEVNATTPGDFELPYEAGGPGEPVPVEYYSQLEEEAGTEGG